MLMVNDVPPGNMGSVLLAWASTAKDAIKHADEYALTHPLNAQIVSDCTPRWHVVITRPGEEGIASGHLIGRRFGVYQPMETKHYPACRGRAAYCRNLPLFRGYLFVFVWDINAHVRRIMACPGVSRVLCDGSRAAIVPDQLINDLQAREAGMTAIPRRSRRKKKHSVEEPVEIVRIAPYSALHGIESLDDAGRISLLHRALGLASSVPILGTVSANGR
jgi:transposase InsO family protein